MDRYKYIFANECGEIDGLEYGDETMKIVVNTKGHIGEISQDFKDFINAVNGKFDSTEFSAKIKSEVDDIKHNKKWRREYMTLYMHEQDLIRKSKAEGRAEGMTEATDLAIKNMLKKLSVEDVIELGYDKDLVMKIAEEK